MQSLDNISSRLATHAMGRIQQGERILGATAKRLRNPAVTLAQYQDRLSSQRRSLQSLTYRAIEDLDIGRIATSLVSATKGRINDEQARLDRARERLSPPIHQLRALEQSRPQSHAQAQPGRRSTAQSIDRRTHAAVTAA